MTQIEYTRKPSITTLRAAFDFALNIANNQPKE